MTPLNFYSDIMSFILMVSVTTFHPNFVFHNLKTSEYVPGRDCITDESGVNRQWF